MPANLANDPSNTKQVVTAPINTDASTVRLSKWEKFREEVGHVPMQIKEKVDDVIIGKRAMVESPLRVITTAGTVTTFLCPFDVWQTLKQMQNRPQTLPGMAIFYGYCNGVTSNIVRSIPITHRHEIEDECRKVMANPLGQLLSACVIIAFADATFTSFHKNRADMHMMGIKNFEFKTPLNYVYFARIGYGAKFAKSFLTPLGIGGIGFVYNKLLYHTDNQYGPWINFAINLTATTGIGGLVSLFGTPLEVLNKRLLETANRKTMKTLPIMTIWDSICSTKGLRGWFVGGIPSAIKTPVAFSALFASEYLLRLIYSNERIEKYEERKLVAQLHKDHMLGKHTFFHHPQSSPATADPIKEEQKTIACKA